MRSFWAGLIVALVAGMPAHAASVSIGVEGGGASFTADPVQAYGVNQGSGAFDRMLNVTEGSYGRFDASYFPMTGWASGMGFGVVAQGWRGGARIAETVPGFAVFGADNGVSACCSSPGDDFTSTVRRSYAEISPQFFWAFQSAQPIVVGVEPFFGSLSERVSTSSPFPITRSSNVDGMVSGVLVSGQTQFALGEAWRLMVRGGGGLYSINAKATSYFDGFPVGVFTGAFSDRLSGFRGQLAFSVERDLAPGFRFGVVTRFDYWSSYPTFRTRDYGTSGTPNGPESLGHEDLFSAFLGLRLSARTGG